MHEFGAACPGVRIAWPNRLRASNALHLEDDHAQRRRGDVHRPWPSVHRQRTRLDAPQIALPTAAIQRRVAIQDLFPVAALRRPDTVLMPRYRSEVTNE